MSASDTFEGVELIEPNPSDDRSRGSFRHRYAHAGEIRGRMRNPMVHEAGWRLMDLCLCIAESYDDEYFNGEEAGEFAVVDVVTKQKAWFEMPHDCNPDMVTGMIASHFNASAFRVGEKLWFV